MRGDGDGWTRCASGHDHWGLFGAAGLLVRAPGPGGPFVLLQHRAAWSHNGNTWGVPGGAIDSDESAAAGALRETAEEASLDPAAIRVRGSFRDDHGGWSYTTVVADVSDRLPTTTQGESIELRWVPEQDVADLPLHPGFAASWPALGAPAGPLVSDVANVVGARPDGWWRDRAGAAEGLVHRLAGIPPRTVLLPGGGYRFLDGVIAVVEGQGRAVPDVPGLTVARAHGSGDDDVVAHASACAGALVVTADRGLRDRLPAQVPAVGPRWLWDLLDPADGGAVAR